jgi:transcriptional regulator with XRE-family HTH domain
MAPPPSRDDFAQTDGRRLRDLLYLANMSGRELSRRLGESSMWASSRMRGAAPITLPDLRRICAVLDITPAEFLDYGTVPARFRPTGGAAAAALLSRGETSTLRTARELAVLLTEADDAEADDVDRIVRRNASRRCPLASGALETRPASRAEERLAQQVILLCREAYDETRTPQEP